MRIVRKIATSPLGIDGLLIHAFVLQIVTTGCTQMHSRANGDHEQVARLAFNHADYSDVLSWIEKETGSQFVKTSNIHGVLTLESDLALTKAEIYYSFRYMLVAQHLEFHDPPPERDPGVGTDIAYPSIHPMGYTCIAPCQYELDPSLHVHVFSLKAITVQQILRLWRSGPMPDILDARNLIFGGSDADIAAIGKRIAETDHE